MERLSATGSPDISQDRYAAMVGAEVIGTALTLGAASGVVAVAIGAAAVITSASMVRGLMDISLPQSDTDKTRQQTVRGTIEPQKIIYGEALVSGPIAFVGVAGTDNNDLYHAVALAGHECESIGSVFFDLEEITTAQINGSGQVTAGVYGPTTDDPSTYIATIEKKLGTTTQSASTLLDSTFSAVTTAHQGKVLPTLSPNGASQRHLRACGTLAHPETSKLWSKAG